MDIYEYLYIGNLEKNLIINNYNNLHNKYFYFFRYNFH